VDDSNLVCDPLGAVGPLTNNDLDVEANETSDLDRLFHRLEGMPLALTQAGAYIRQTNISVREYLEHYDNTWDDLIAKQDMHFLVEYAQRSMLTTWKISYQQVERRSVEAAQLLKLWAYLDLKDMWYELIACSVELQSQIQIPEWLLTLAKDRLKFISALGLLKKYSLVNDGTDTANYSMHAVLHSWFRRLASMSSVDEAFPELAASIVAQMVPHEDDEKGWILERRLFPHGQQLLSYLRLGVPWRLSHISAIAYEMSANLLESNHANEEAAELLERAVKERERTLGQDHLSTLDVLRRLAYMYSKLGRDRHTKSEELYKRVLAGCEKLYRPDQTNSRLMSNTLFGLGQYYIGQESFKKGEESYKRALEVCDQQPGADKRTVLRILCAMAAFYYQQSRFVEAEGMLQRALARSMEMFGSDHFRTFMISSGLCEVYYMLGKTAQAEEMTKRTAAVYDKNFSGQHEFIAVSIGAG
jgi:tetratricopeptide (TPR) repeat protein